MMKAIRAGRLDRTVVIEKNTPTTDAVNALVESWSTLATVAADVMDRGVSEKFRADRFDGVVDKVFLIRYRADVTRENRIVYGGLNYNIVGVEEIGRRVGLEIAGRAID